MKMKDKICKVTNRWSYKKNKVSKSREQVIVGSYIMFADRISIISIYDDQ